MRPPAALLLLALAGCHSQSPEAKIRAAFQSGVAAVEAGDVAAAVALLAPDFQGPEGMDRPGAGLFLAALLRGQKAGITVVAQKIAVEGGQAVQSVDLLLTGRGGAGLLPDQSSRRSLVLRWQLREGKWLVKEILEG